MSFPLSFHLALLSPTGADWLDDPPDVSCQDSTCQHAVDGPLLSCKQLPCQERYAEAFSSLPGRCFGLVAHPGEAGPTLCPETVAWRGSPRAPSGRRYRIEPAKATGRRRTAATARPSLAAGRPGRCQAAGTPGRPATPPH
jgi:hypothetical protein